MMPTHPPSPIIIRQNTIKPRMRSKSNSIILRTLEGCGIGHRETDRPCPYCRVGVVTAWVVGGFEHQRYRFSRLLGLPK